MDDLLLRASEILGVSPTSLVLLLGFLYGVANFLARAIPDNSTGWLGVVRTIAKLIGLYQSSKIAPGVTISAATKAALGLATVRNGVKAQIDDPAKAEHVDSVMKEIASDLPTGLFKKSAKQDKPDTTIRMPILTTLLALTLSILILSGCATTQERICSHASAIRAAAQATINAVNQCPGEPASGLY